MPLLLRPQRLAPAALVAAAIFLPSSAHAVGPRTFDLDTMEKLTGGDLKGVSVSSDGIVRTGWTLGDVPLTDAQTVFCALPLADGSVLLGTGLSGKILKVERDRATVFADTKELAVLSLVQDAHGTIYAGTSADEQQGGGSAGKVFKIAQGRADLFATLPSSHYVWALAMDPAKTTLYAAVGPDNGRIFRVQPGDGSQVVFKSDDLNLVSLAVADNGDLFAGSSPKGLLYRVPAPGTGTAGAATVLYDFPGEEVRPIAVSKGVVYAVNNEYGEPPEPPRRAAPPGSRPAGPTTGGPRPKPGKGSLWRFDAQWRPERLMHHDEFQYVSLAIDPTSGAPYVGSGAEGRVFTVDDAHVVTQVVDTDERQVGAIGFVGGKPFVATSDPPVFHPLLGVGGANAVWTSKVLDAGLRARFGQLSWRGTGSLQLSLRSGETGTPDATWSAWSAPVTQPRVVPVPTGRFVQVRASFADANATLSEVVLPFVTENVRPVVLSISASQPSVRESREGLVASGGPPAKHDSTVHVTWKVDDTDNDPLRYRLFFRREGETIWRDMLRSDEVVTEADYKWDTASLPEGKYRVRVEASDEPSNPPDQVLRHALDSAPVLVDNTPPTLVAAITQRRIRAHAVDGLGPIVRVELSVDGHGEWRPLAAADGIFDTQDETVDADVSMLVPPGPHIVALRAYDAAGNSVVQDVEAQ